MKRKDNSTRMLTGFSLLMSWLTSGAALLFFTCMAQADAPVVETYTNSGLANWTCPTGVNFVQVEVWGGGGAGGGGLRQISGAKNGCGGGGGGGAYARFNAYTVNPASVYAYNVGANGVAAVTNNGSTGGDSWFVNSSTLDAAGGSGGGVGIGVSNSNFGPGNGQGAGGSGAVIGTSGDAIYAGGNGATPSSGSGGGGGGGSGGYSSIGNSASGSTGGAAVTAGGAGGWGNTGSGNGTNGIAPGGGGGGARSANVGLAFAGGNGAFGQVQLTYFITPYSQASGISFSAVGSNSMTISWAPGSGSNSIVLVKADTAVDASPVNGIVYTDNLTFGSGSQIGSANYVVYQGTGNSASISGLSIGTTYYVAVYSFNGLASPLSEYLTNSPAAGSATPGNQPVVSASTQSGISINSATLGATVVDDNGNAITNYGVVWGTSAYPTITNNMVVKGTTEMLGPFTVNVTGLPASTVIHYRGYATSAAGTGYSSDDSFFTLTDEPTVQASGVSFSSVQANGATVSWTRGNGSSCIVMVKAGAAVDAEPVDGTSYTANANFGSGSQIGVGNYVTYLGTGSSFSLTALAPGTTYYIAVYELNGSGGSENYLTTSPATGSVSIPYVLTISNQPQQLIQMGVDGEFVTYWRPQLSNTLSQLAVQYLRAQYARVAIYCGYELDQGVYQPTNYTPYLQEMTSLRAANPNIQFMASPMPLQWAYTPEQVTNLWGGDVPYTPYPSWVETFTNGGTNGDGTTKWVAQSLNDANLTQYLADYLNFMYTNGFAITYLDVINEQTFVQPSDVAYVSSHLSGLLNPGVTRPLLVVPSTWSEDEGVGWIELADPATYDIASTHNTGGDEEPAAFVAAAQAAGKPAWNTEFHNWIGKDMGSEVTNSLVFWDHLIAGFTGIDTWLFYGNSGGGGGHPMLFSSQQTVQTTCKYEIFKEMVNNANGGNYVGVGTGSLSNVVESAAFTNNGIQTVWVLNLTGSQLTNIVFQFAGEDLTGQNIAVKSWYASGTPYSDPSYDVEKYGVATSFAATNASFSYSLAGQTLYCFRLAPPPPVSPTDAITIYGSTNSYQDIGGNWQTLSDDSINNGGYLGSDGYVFFGSFNGSYTSITSPTFGLYIAHLPAYVTSLVAGTNYGGVMQNSSYALMDSPLLTNSLEVPASIVWGSGSPSGNQQLLQFTVTGLLSGTVVRVGVMADVDGSKNKPQNPASITLSQGTNSATVGNAAVSPLPENPMMGVANGSGWVFFDITTNGTYAVSAAELPGSTAVGIAGLTFDSYVTSSNSSMAQVSLPNLSSKITSNKITLSWPSSFLGWSLQMQTNSLASGLGTNWITIPGCETMTTTDMPVTAPAAFYRLIQQRP